MRHAMPLLAPREGIREDWYRRCDDERITGRSAEDAPDEHEVADHRDGG